MLTSTKVGKIVRNAFPLMENDRVDSIRNSLMEDLAVWESQLPPELQYQGSGVAPRVRFWSSMLHVAYKYRTPPLTPRYLADFNAATI